MSEKIAVIMEFNGYTQDELQDYLTLKFGSMTKGGMTASVLSQIGYKRAKAVILDRPQLNENQRIVLEWLKNEKESSGMTMFDCIYLFIYGNSKDVILQFWSELSTKEEAQVLQAFSQWAILQEEE